MSYIEIKIINNSNNSLPSYKTAGAAGMDLRAFLLDGSITIQPLERKLINTGLQIEIPFGFEGQVRPRSGIALNHGVTVLNTPGTIDSDYRGEIKVLLINFGDKDFIINNGDRIAQIVFCKHEQGVFINSSDLSDSKRGTKGYGHTGIN